MTKNPILDAIVNVMRDQYGHGYWSDGEGSVSNERQILAWHSRGVCVRDLAAILGSPEVIAAVRAGAPDGGKEQAR